MADKEGHVTAAVITGLAAIIVALIGVWFAGSKPTEPPPPATSVSHASNPPVAAPPVVDGGNRGFPATTSDVVYEFGGTAAEWTQLPPNGWIYRSAGSGALSFVVPAGCVVDDPKVPTGKHHQPGEQINADQLTVYCPA